MCDAFKIDWCNLMKNNDVANGIAHSKQNEFIVDVLYAPYTKPYEIRQHIFDSYEDAIATYPETPSSTNIYARLDYPHSRFNFFSYRTPPSIYNLHQPSLR